MGEYVTFDKDDSVTVTYGEYSVIFQNGKIVILRSDNGFSLAVDAFNAEDTEKA